MSERARQLLVDARDGNPEAFAEIVRLYEARVRGVLGRLLDDEREVEEAAQDTFVQAWRNLDRFRGDSGPYTWIYRIAVNEALQRVRRRRPEVAVADDVDRVGGARIPQLGGKPVPVEVAAAEREAVRFLADRIRRLPYESRAPLVLRDIEGWSYEEVADVLGLSLAATKSRIHRARMLVAEDYRAWQAGRDGRPG